MRFTSRLAIVAAIFTSHPSQAQAQAQTAGKNLAMDFRTTISVQREPDSAVMTGHAVGTADKMRVEVRGLHSKAAGLPIDSVVTMILTDSGKTITYVDTKKSQYLRVRP